jgi:hypothetical protein
LMYECQVCYKQHVESKLIAVEAIKNSVLHRVYPWLICYECAEKISDALKVREGKNE